MGASTGAIRAGRAFVEFILSDDKFKNQLSGLSGRMAAVGQKMQKVGGAMSAGIAPVSAVFGLAIHSFANFGDEMAKMSKRTGIAVKDLTELKFAAERSGTDIATVEGAFKRMAKSISAAGQGSAGTNDALARIGLTVQQLQGLNPSQQFDMLGAAIAGIEDPTLRAAAAQDIFGRAGTKLLPLFSEGATGLASLRAEANRLGLTLTNEDAAAAEQLQDALGDMKSVVFALFVHIGKAVAGPATEFAHWLRDVVAMAIEFIKQHQDLVKWVGIATAAVAAIVVPLTAVGTAVTIGITAFGGLAAAAGVLSAAFAFLLGNPIVLVLAGVAAAAYAIWKYFSGAADATNDFADGADHAANAVAGVKGPKKPTADPDEARIADLQAQAAQIQRRVGQPAIATGGMSQSLNAEMRNVLGAPLQKIESYTQRTADAAELLVRLFRQGGGFIAGTD